MHNNYHFLQSLAIELNTHWVGQKLLTCFSQEKDELVIGFSNDEYLKLILKPDFSAVTVVHDFSRARKNSASLWEKYYDFEVLAITCFPYERAIKIVLEQEVLLVIKLFGNRPNVLVYEAGVLVDMFNKHLLTDKNLLLSDFEKTVQWTWENFKNLEGNYRKMFFTFGKDIFAYLEPQLQHKTLEEQWLLLDSFRANLENPKFYIDEKGLLPQLSLIKGEEQVSAIAAINTFVARYQKVSAVDKLKADLTQKLSKDITKYESYIKTTEKKLKDLKEGVKNEEIGNILMANLHAIASGLNEVELFNFYTNSPITIKLKKDLSAQKNAEAYYRKAKNEKIEIETIEANLEAAQSKLLEAQILLEEIQPLEDLKSLRNQAKWIQKNSVQTSKDELPFKEYVKNGVKIWVGRNSKNNDLLLTQYAHKEDWWLHARDTAGSHVVIKNPKPTKEVLEYAASIAAYYSKRRSESLVTVIYTQKKYVRKAKNLAAGQVIIDKEQTMLVEPKDG